MITSAVHADAPATDPPAPSPLGRLTDPPPPRPRGRTRLARGPSGDPTWARPALLVLLAATAVLYLWGLGASGYGNGFYAAATQAGTQSWKALLFGSLDAGNAITVDKPPASLWISGLVARVFGFSSWTVLAPQAIEGVAAVGLLHATVRRTSGAAAGLLAGAAFALTPVAVLMFRFNNPDALLVLLLVAAAYCTVRATERAGVRWLLLAGACVGFAFLTKMAQAFLVVPAFGLVYLIAAPTGLRRRIVHLVAAAAAVVVSAGWYVALVEVWPASSRPYIGGSTDNSLLQLALGYNGLGRIFGGGTHGGGTAGGAGAGNHGFGGNGFGGATGITRLFGSSMGAEISWLLPAALIALVAGLWMTRRAPRTDPTRAALVLWGGWLLVTGLVFSFMSGITHPYYTVALAPAVAALTAIGGVTLWRRRSRLAARAVAALMVAASGGWAFVLLDRVPSWLPALRWAVAGLAVLVAGALLVARPVPGASVPGASVDRRAARIRRATRVTAVLGAAAVITVSAGSSAYALATAAQPHSGSIPTSGPAVAGGAMAGGGPGGAMGTRPGDSAGGRPGSTAGAGSSTSTSTAAASSTSTSTGPVSGAQQQPSGRSDGGFGAGGGGGQTSNAALVKLLKASTTTWAAATTSGASSAADLELNSGKAVLAIGGWDGSDPAPTLAQFQRWVTEGRIHYFIGSGFTGSGTGTTGGPGGTAGPGGRSSNAGSQIATWVAAHYTATTVGGQTVYDLTASTTG